MKRHEMEDCLREIVACTNRIYKRERHWGIEGVVLMNPAGDDEIKALSSSLPFQLPATYTQFLSLHNGCLGFWPHVTLLGTSGQCRDIIAAEIADARDHQRQFVEDKHGQITGASIAAFETPTAVRKCMYLPGHTVLGTDQSGGFLIFNEKEVTPEGEFQVVDYTYDGDTGDVYPDFGAFLVGTLSFLEQRIKDKKY